MTPPPSLWQAEDVLRAVRGRSLFEQSWGANGVAIDSRLVKPGDLFVALKGPTNDGHDHVAAAFAAGASAALVERQPMQIPPDAPLIFVDDTLVALQDLGIAGRARAKGKILAVTGSVGKTSTKEMLRLCLGRIGFTFANAASYNNQWGVPLTLANLPPDAEFGIFEIGMNHKGEISELTRMVRPQAALITTIEPAHLEFFGTTEAIADAKAEIFEGMDASGIVVLNIDNPHYGRLAAAAKARGIKKILSFGASPKADARLVDCISTREGCAVNATINGVNIHYAIGAPGEHLVRNSLGALLLATTVGAEVEPCATALSEYRPPKGRGISQRIELTSGSFTLIDESYNANPASMRAALQVLGTHRPEGQGRRIAVLGDMRELGETAPQLHTALAEVIEAAKIDLVFCCGEMMKLLFEALPAAKRGAHTDDSAALAPLVAAAVRENDSVTVKGSLSMKMATIVMALKGLATDEPKKLTA